ncbi:nitrate reductase associated protein [Oscillatoria salina]|uniref:nitrate reductase associated protein n=1 Tax=Oscillatoria salina TaxID=331517 RepID=UPI0013B892C0|nr:nitrate reductase associated protein [Oscillatoria salina]MBZ8179384.1 nitrate reductase maturation protein NarM [Oscillatoria salina IIICB1]NET87877.1 nitrate reductase maturation protein NarM [Kamptonema sp. SIO1D9]
MSKFFDFEADFVDSLRCIPMQVRYKLDTCGVKLKLNHWHQFSEEERRTLVEIPCQTESEARGYREYLQNLVTRYTGSEAKELAIAEHPPWLDGETVPTDTQIKAQEFGVAIAPQQWANLTPLQRFALIKLSRPSHENKNFYPALKEFHLI